MHYGTPIFLIYLATKMKPISFLTESFSLTLRALLSHKLRSLLSIVGVTIGIFCIVGILTATYSLEKNIRSNIDELGDNIVYVQKWPWAFSGGYQWWKYMNRPQTTLTDFRQIDKYRNTEVIDHVVFYFESRNNKISSPLNTHEGVRVGGVSNQFFDINQWPIASGRSFTEFEFEKGKNVAIIGSGVAEEVYPTSNPVGKNVKVNGKRVEVIGVFEERGDMAGMQNYDDLLLLPHRFALSMAKPNTQGVESSIIVKGKDGVGLKSVKFEIKRLMRGIRKLRPKEGDNFAINELTMLSDGLSQTFMVINIVGWILGGFSLLVGGFGIANIMYVSVKERTAVIGLQKSLGAKKRFILSQFLIEAIVLCILGALIGIGLAWALSFAFNLSTDSGFVMHFSMGVITTGLLIAVLIGIVAGVSPALRASRLDPVVALRK